MISVIKWTVGMSVLYAVLCAGGSVPQQMTPAVNLVRLPEGALQPQIAIGLSGRVHVVYFTGEAAGGDLFYAQIRPDDSFSSPVRVNSQKGSAIATGNVRGAQLAIGTNDRVHVVWNGSSSAEPRAAGGAPPMLYSRMELQGNVFGPQRNLVQFATGLDGGGAIDADASGRVYVAWHAGGPDSRNEGDRRVWVTMSSDGGTTFSRERPASEIETGACGCCGMSGLVDRRGNLYLMYRSARAMVHRDAYLLTSKDHAQTFASTKLQDWNIAACPMSMFELIEAGPDILAAWETAGQVQFVRINGETGARSTVVAPPGQAGRRKHPVLASNSRGDVLTAWTEGMSWQRGGGVAWQIFDKEGRPTSELGHTDGVPPWSLVAAFARPDGGFTIVY
jgi:hypothetical protein